MKVHQSGPWKGLPIYEENLQEVCAASGRTNIVARVCMTDGHGESGTLCRGVISGQTFHLKTDLEESTVVVTVLNAKCSYYRGPVLVPDQHSEVLQHAMRDTSHLFEVVETCSGIGGIGLGARYAGFTPQSQNELMPLFCAHQRKYSKTPTIEGNICHLGTVAALHKSAPTAGVLAWGFSCQPFSRAGDQRQGMDERSATLPYGLFAGFFTPEGIPDHRVCC